MKHIRPINFLNERAIVRKPMPIGDFIYDKFFGKVGHGAPRIKDNEIDLNAKLSFKSFYEVEISLFKNSDGDLNIDTLNMLLECRKFMELYAAVEPNFYWTNPSMVINQHIVEIGLFLTQEKVDEIKNLPEYEKWYKDVENKYDNFQTRKMAKKYNM